VTRFGNVSFTAKWAGVTVAASSTGVLNGDVLSWTAHGTASRAGLDLPHGASRDGEEVGAVRDAH
jgi:hypothetical protein